MPEIVMSLFKACILATLPNVHTIQNLTQEQVMVLRKYTEDKCKHYVAINACAAYKKKYNKEFKDCGRPNADI